MTISRSSKGVVCEAVSLVAPSHPVPSYSYFLSNLDLLHVSSPIYLPSVYYFRTKKNDPARPSIQSLKDSLSKVLSIYPIFAGRLKTAAEAGRMEVDVNGGGVPFIEATTNAKLDDWPDLHFCEIEEELNPKDQFVTDIFTAPLIRVQFTTFRCGGMALGFNSLHAITDGLATMEFLRAWGEVHRGVKISTPPCFDSIKLRSRDPPIVKIAMADELFSTCKPLVNVTSPPDDLLFPSVKSIGFKNIVFRIERHMISKCIRDVESGAFSYGPSCTSFEAISALFWTAVTRARGLEDTATTSYIFPVNVRGKCKPQLPKGYFGNAVILNQVTATAKDIKSNHFSFAASLINKRLQMVESEFIQSGIDWMELRLKGQQAIGVGIDTTSGSNMINTSFANFPIYDINFGHKLDQFVFTTPESYNVDGLLHILPPPPHASERSREVKLRLRVDHLDRLLHDSEFGQYFWN